MQVQCRSKTCASKKGDLTKLHLLYKDDSEYNECYAEEWEERDSFKKIITTTQDIPAEIAKCKCILPCADTKIKRLPETDGSHMELPWTEISIPDRCDFQPTRPRSKEKCICKLSSSKGIAEEPKSQCTCTKRPVVQEKVSKCIGKAEQMAERKPTYEIKESIHKCIADERKSKCTCRVHKTNEFKPTDEELKSKCSCRGGLPLVPAEQPKFAVASTCERKPLKTSAEVPTPKCSYDQKMFKPTEEPKPKCNCEQKTVKPLTEHLKPKCIRCAHKATLEEPKPKYTCEQKSVKTSAEVPTPKCSYDQKMFKPTEESKPKCNCEQKTVKPLSEDLKPKCTFAHKTSVEETKPKCTCEQKSVKPVAEELKPSFNYEQSSEGPRAAVEEVKLKCACERKSLKTSAEVPTPKCSYDQKMLKPTEESKPKCNCEQKTVKPLSGDLKPKCTCASKTSVEETKPKCTCEQKSVKPDFNLITEELKSSFNYEQTKPVVGESRGMCSCKQQTTPSVEEQKLKCEEIMQKPSAQETCGCKTVGKEPLNLPKCVSENSKQIKPVIKTFTCSGRKAVRDLPTRIPTPVISIQKPSREDEVKILKPPEKVQVVVQKPPREEQKGPCDCETNKKTSQKLEQSAPKSNLAHHAFDDDDQHQDNGEPEQGNTNEAPTDNKNAPQQPEGTDESQVPEQPSSGEGQAGGSGTGGTGGDDGKKPSQDDASRPCQCARSEISMDEEQRCLEESKRNPMKLVYDNLCYEANEPYMDPLSKIYPDDCETYCGPSTEIPWSEILIPKGVKLRQAKKSKREKYKTTRSTNTDTDLNKKL